MGEPDAGNLHVRFEEGPGRAIGPPGLLYSLCERSLPEGPE